MHPESRQQPDELLIKTLQRIAENLEAVRKLLHIATATLVALLALRVYEVLTL